MPNGPPPAVPSFDRRRGDLIPLSWPLELLQDNIESAGWFLTRSGGEAA
jgi:hypothetical protein